MRAGYLELQELDVRIPLAKVNLVDRSVGFIGELVAAIDDQQALLGVQLSVQRDVGNGRLRQLLIFEIFALIVRLEFLQLVGGLVPVEDLDVVIAVGAADPHADRGYRDKSDSGNGEPL